MEDGDIVVRMTGDNLLPDGTFVENYLKEFLRSSADYMGSSGTDIDLSYGISTEIFRVGGLCAELQAQIFPRTAGSM